MKTTDITKISGNASDSIKQFLIDPRFSFNTMGEGELTTSFADAVVERIAIVDVSLVKSATEPSKEEATVTCEIRVDEDMANGMANLHGGCSALLIDLCSTLAIATLQMHITGSPLITVSQTLNVVFHAPATIGEELRIINTSMSVGKRVVSARTEIWSITHKRLVASGVHIKMLPTRKSKPTSKM